MGKVDRVGEGEGAETGIGLKNKKRLFQKIKLKKHDLFQFSVPDFSASMEEA